MRCLSNYLKTSSQKAKKCYQNVELRFADIMKGRKNVTINFLDEMGPFLKPFSG